VNRVDPSIREMKAYREFSDEYWCDLSQNHFAVAEDLPIVSSFKKGRYVMVQTVASP
jgi:hypothetical protein